MHKPAGSPIRHRPPFVPLAQKKPLSDTEKTWEMAMGRLHESIKYKCKQFVEQIGEESH
jgi:hypothetical protein